MLSNMSDCDSYRLVGSCLENDCYLWFIWIEERFLRGRQVFL